MILLTYQTPKGLKLGVKTDRGILDIAATVTPGHTDTPVTPDALYRVGSVAVAPLAARVDEALEHGAAEWFHDESRLRLGPPVPNPGKILCIGLNYLRHAQESGMAVPTTPVLFSKFNNAITGPGEDIPLPAHAEEYDYEAELVVVIGRRAKEVSEAEALDYVLGYCNGNDVSERQLQMLTGQWLLGKTLDKFMPLGPYLVTANEAGDPQEMRVRCWLNGELRQDSNTADMIFSVAEVVSYASRYLTLEPGDIISTGTPEGVIFGMEERVWMRPGDEATVEVGNLGQLSNRMVEGR